MANQNPSGRDLVLALVEVLKEVNHTEPESECQVCKVLADAKRFLDLDANAK